MLLNTVSFASVIQNIKNIQFYKHLLIQKLNQMTRALYQYNLRMKRSKSPKKGQAAPIQTDPDMRERARKAQAQHSRKKQSFIDKYSYHLVFGIFGLIMAYALFQSFWKTGPNIHTTLVNDLQYIDHKNSLGNTFEVGTVPMFDNYKLVDVKNIINNQATNKQQLYRCSSGKEASIVPDVYNFRQAYPDCAAEILTQGNCSSSYALAPVSAITDRWCRLNKDKYPKVSPQTPIFCDKAINNNCKGGYVSRTLDYAKIYGLVDEECHKYDSAGETPDECQKKTASCEKFKIADYCVNSEEENIKQQIFNHGPVVAVIPVYRDFLIYKKGLYQVYPKNQKFSSGHAIKIIGWDVRDSKNCWIVENTWGTEWGQNGTACILANQDQLQIQRFTIAAALNNQNIQTTEQSQFETEAGKESTQTQDQEHQQL